MPVNTPDTQLPVWVAIAASLIAIILFIVVVFFFFGSIGSFREASDNNEVIGQVKNVKNIRPLIYPNFTQLQLSLGVLRNNTGSISKEDIELYVPVINVSDVLREAAEKGNLVKVIYNVKRFSFWYPNEQVVQVEILPN